jgi:hypothetical protein
MLNAPATGEAMSELILDGAARRVDLVLPSGNDGLIWLSR